MNPEFTVFSSKTVKQLADATIVARLSHWNCRGKDFYEVHLLFERIYNTLGDKMDSLVEQLRACGFDPDFDLFKGPGISMGFFDAGSLLELNLDYVMALSSVLTLFFNFASAPKDDPRMTGLADLLQSMASEVLQLQYLLLAALGH